MRPSRTIRALAEGARLHLDGWRMLRRERALWGVALVPFLASAATCTAALAAVIVYAAPLHAFVTGWMPVLHADSAVSWLWVAPARAVLGIVGLVLFVAAAASALVLAFLSASILSAPFLDALSRRVEALTLGTVKVAGEGGLGRLLRDAARAAREELRRSVFFLLLQGTIVVLGLVVPGGQVVAAPALVLVTMLFLPLSYAAYTLDRRGVPFATRRRWVVEHAAMMLGYGGTAFLAFLVPGLNFLFLPVLVSSGTLLALRYPPAASRV
ncbi:MAG TPA: EI24 domain-containing protein [Myxococcota bacterium]|nr:EI24 domain-containing protein [Myxococcota bacterium]